MSLFAGIDIRARWCAEKLKELMVLVEGVSEAESDAFTGPGDSAGEAGSVKKIESAVHICPTQFLCTVRIYKKVLEVHEQATDPFVCV